MFFNGANVPNGAPTKSDDIDNGIAPSPWANIISVGLKIITALLGGGANNDGIDKVDNGNSPMQVGRAFLVFLAFNTFFLNFIGGREKQRNSRTLELSKLTRALSSSLTSCKKKALILPNSSHFDNFAQNSPLSSRRRAYSQRFSAQCSALRIQSR